MDEILEHLQEAMAILTVPDGESLPFEQVKDVYEELIEAQKAAKNIVLVPAGEVLSKPETEAEKIMRLLETEGLSRDEPIRWSLMNEEERLQILEIMCCNAAREAQREEDYSTMSYLVVTASKMMRTNPAIKAKMIVGGKTL